MALKQEKKEKKKKHRWKIFFLVIKTDFPFAITLFGCWCRLFSYGIGIHLLQSDDPENMPKKKEINPKDNHISFQVVSVPRSVFLF